MFPGGSDFLSGTTRFTFSRELMSQIRFDIGRKKPSTLSKVPKTISSWKIHTWLRFTSRDILMLHSWVTRKKTLEKSKLRFLILSLFYEGGKLSTLFSPTIQNKVTCIQCSCSREPIRNSALLSFYRRG